MKNIPSQLCPQCQTPYQVMDLDKEKDIAKQYHARIEIFCHWVYYCSKCRISYIPEEAKCHEIFDFTPQPKPDLTKWVKK